LPDAIRIYLDTNIFIYAIERPSTINGEVADLLLDLIGIAPSRGVLKIVTSELFLAEVLVAPYAANDMELIARYEAIQTQEFNIDVMKIALDILRIAARIRSKTQSIRLPDAIHLATAVNAKCTHFLTADAALANRSTQAGLKFAVCEPSPKLLLELLKILSSNE
jgi:predicted nucleic acid-binding protein